MSLLMDALRKAEEQKRKAQQDAKSETATASPVGEVKSSDAATKPSALTLEPQVGATPDQPTVESSLEVPTWLGRAKRKTRQSIPDVELQLEDIVPAQQAEVAETGTIEPPAAPEKEREPEPSSSRTESAAGVSGTEVIPAPNPSMPETSSKRIPQTQRSAADGAIHRSQANAVFAAKVNVARQKTHRRVMVLSALGSVMVILVFGGMYFFRDSGGGLQVSIEGFDPNLQSPPMPVAEAAVEAVALTDPQVVESVTELDPRIEELIPLPATEIPEAIAESPALVVGQRAGGQTADTATPVDPVVELRNILAEEIQPTSQATESALLPVTVPEVVPPVSSITFVRREVSAGIDPVISQAFAAYQAGDLDQARSLYQQVLSASPLHRDALLGMATIARINGENLAARDFYTRLLTRDPADPVARAGMLELVPSGNTVSQERQLRQMLERYPGEAPLAFALGNLLASQQRWSEAQQAYFDALQIARAASAAAINPDYAFNLAVSLDHLGQSAAALTFYRQAREFAAVHPAGFDLTELDRKLANADRSLAP
ncbi:MAG: tetratricopeptide repeat protein [Pseudohongiellaceae bacterium]